jgi:hypothetical protein
MNTLFNGWLSYAGMSVNTPTKGWLTFTGMVAHFEPEYPTQDLGRKNTSPAIEIKYSYNLLFYYLQHLLCISLLPGNEI